MNEERGALFSGCNNYRYRLWRIWDKRLQIAMCVGLNPSTANWQDDDPTIRKLRDILKHYGYGGFYMTNLYALVSSKPAKLFSVSDPQKANDQHLKEVMKFTGDMFACWGTFDSIEYRAKKVLQMAEHKKKLCFGKSKFGIPIHPAFYVRRGTPADQVPILPL